MGPRTPRWWRAGAATAATPSPTPGTPSGSCAPPRRSPAPSRTRSSYSGPPQPGPPSGPPGRRQPCGSRSTPPSAPPWPSARCAGCATRSLWSSTAPGGFSMARRGRARGHRSISAGQDVTSPLGSLPRYSLTNRVLRAKICCCSLDTIFTVCVCGGIGLQSCEC